MFVTFGCTTVCLTSFPEAEKIEIEAEWLDFTLIETTGLNGLAFRESIVAVKPISLTSANVAMYIGNMRVLPIMLVLLVFAAANEHRIIRAVVLEDMQPNTFINPETDSLTGFQVELLDILAKKLDYKVKYIAVGNWKTVDSLIRIGMADVCPVLTMSEERKSFVVLGEPVETFGLSIAVRSNDNEIEGAGSLTGKKVGVIRKSQASYYLADKPEIRCIEYDSFHKAIFSLLAGQIDAFVAPNTVIMYIVRQINLEDRVKLIEPPLKEHKRSFGFRLDRKELCDSFNIEIDKFLSTHDYRHLHEKWFGEPRPFMTSKEIIALATVLIIMVTIFMASWRYRSLSRKNRELEYNIKKRIEAEKNLQKSIEELEKIQRLESLGVLAGGIAHDFNNLLGGLFGYIDIARLKAIKDSSSAVEPLTKGIAVYNRAKDLTKQLLTFAKGAVPVKEPVDLGKLLKQADDISLGGSSVDCKISVAENLYPVEGDAGQLHQVFSNILINARQAMPGGGIITVNCKNIDVTAENYPVLKPGKYIEIVIVDTGMGIPAAIIDKVFDPFFTTKQTGSGLGLATTFSIVRKHGGHLLVSSIEGKGTTVRVLLPASSA